MLAHERATSPLFQASAFAFRSFPLLLRLPLAFAPSGNKRHHHHHQPERVPGVPVPLTLRRNGMGTGTGWRREVMRFAVPLLFLFRHLTCSQATSPFGRGRRSRFLPASAGSCHYADHAQLGAAPQSSAAQPQVSGPQDASQQGVSQIFSPLRVINVIIIVNATWVQEAPGPLLSWPRSHTSCPGITDHCPAASPRLRC